MDKKARDESPKVVLVRIADDQLKQMKEPSCVLHDAETATLTLSGLEPMNWDEMLEDQRGEYTPDL